MARSKNQTQINRKLFAVCSSTQAQVNRLSVAVLGDDDAGIKGICHRLEDAETAIDKFTRYGLIALGMYVAFQLWWQVDLKDRFFGDRTDVKSELEMLTREIKALKQAK